MEIRNKKYVSILLPGPAGPGSQPVEMMGGRGGNVSFIAAHTLGIQNT